MAQDVPTFEDAVMPRSTIKNCAKDVIKPDTMIQRDALTAIARGSTVFISYLTAYANEIALSKKRKTIMPADVFEALKTIEFERFIPDLRANHEAMEAEAKDRRTQKTSLVAAAAVAAVSVQEDGDEDNDGELPLPKKARVEDGDEDGANAMEVELDADTAMHSLNENEDGDAELEDEEEDDDDLVGQEDDDEEAEDEEQEEEEEEEEEDEMGIVAEAETSSATIHHQEDRLEDFDKQQPDTYDEALDNGEDSD